MERDAGAEHRGGEDQLALGGGGVLVGADLVADGADNTDRYAEDAPVRVVLAFEGDKRTLPFRDQLFFEQVNEAYPEVWAKYKPEDD